MNHTFLALVAVVLSLFAPLTAHAQTYFWTSIAGRYRNVNGPLSFAPGTGSAALLPALGRPDIDADGNLYVPGYDAKAIYKITPDGVVTLFASGFTQPWGVAVQGSNLWVADGSALRVVNLNTPVVTTPTFTFDSSVTPPVLGQVFNVVFLDGRIYFSGGVDSDIRYFDATAANKVVFALGVTTATGTPSNIKALAADRQNNRLYFVNSLAGTPSKDEIYVRASNGTVTKVAGGDSGNVDGNGVDARFSGLGGIACNAAGTNLFIFDSSNRLVRRMDISNASNVVSTIGGTPGPSGSAEGSGSTARFGGSSVNGLAVGPGGEVLLAESTGTYGRVVRGVNSFAATLSSPVSLAANQAYSNILNVQTSQGGAGGTWFFDDGAGKVVKLGVRNDGSFIPINPKQVNPGDGGAVLTAEYSGGFGFSSRYTFRLEYLVNGTRVYVQPVLDVPVDTVGPVFGETRNSITVEAVSVQGAPVIFTETASDTPAGVFSTNFGFQGQPVNSGFLAPLGTNSLGLSATDNVGNSSTKSITINVVDTTPPTASVPETIIVEADANGTVTLPDLTANVAATDAVTALNAIVITQDLTVGDVYPIGRYPITFTVKDLEDNTRTVNSTVVVAYPAVTAPTLVTAVRGGGAVKKVVQGEFVPNKPPGSSLALTEAYYLSFGSPALSDRRDMFATTVIQNDKGTLTGIVQVFGDGSHQLLQCSTGIAADDTGSASGQNYASFGAPFCSPNGCIAFLARLDDKTTGLWSNVLVGRDFGVRRILQTGTGLNLPIANATLAAINGASAREGELLVLVTLAGPSTAVTRANNLLLLRLTADTQTQAVVSTPILRTGGSQANLAGTVTGISVFSAPKGTTGQGRAHGDSQIAIRAATVEGKIKSNKFLLVADDNSFSPELADGGSANGDIGVTVLRMNPPSARDAASAVRATVLFNTEKKNAEAIVCGRFTPGGVFVGARTGVSIGGGLSFRSLGDPVVNDTPAAVFSATLAGATIKPAASSALYQVSANQTRREIVRAGQPVSDADGNAIADTAWTRFTNYCLPDGNGVVFTAEMGGKAAIAKGKVGLWAEDNSGTPKRRLLLHVGQSLDFGGTPKTVQSFRLLDTPAGALGIQRSYNALKSVAAVVTFTDRSQTLLRIDLP